MPNQIDAEKKLIICTKKKWCKRLDERLANLANAHTKGLSVFVITNLRTGKNTVKGVRYRKTPNDPGFVLNYCPFCGTNLYFLFEVSGLTEST